MKAPFGEDNGEKPHEKERSIGEIIQDVIIRAKAIEDAKPAYESILTTKE